MSLRHPPTAPLPIPPPAPRAPRGRGASHDEPPPRIPYADQRLIRVAALLAIVGIAASTAVVLNVDPSIDTAASLGAALLFGTTTALLIAPVLLVESYRRHPGQWRGRRRRALRRSALVGGLVAGYVAFRVAGIGNPTGLAIAALLLVIAEVALSRSDEGSV